MKKNKIEDYISKLKDLDNQISGIENPDDKITTQFAKKLENVLLSLNEEIVGEMTTKVQSTPTLDVRFKKLNPKAVKPTYSKEWDAGLDITTISQTSNTTEQVIYSTGIAIEIPRGYVGLLFPRSSVRNYQLTLSNCVGVIDCTFRGEIEITFNKNNGLDSFKYKPGNRIAQLVILPLPKINLIESDELSETERGDQGHGHSGV